MKTPTLTEHLARQPDRHYPPRNTDRKAGTKKRSNGWVPKPQNISSVTIEEIMDCAAKGMTQPEAAEVLGISAQRISKRVREAGLRWPKVGRKPRRAAMSADYSGKDPHKFRSEAARALLSRFWTQEGMA